MQQSFAGPETTVQREENRAGVKLRPFRHDRALWAAEDLPFRVEFFHPGYLYQEPVRVCEFTATHDQDITGISAAIVFPIYNEDAVRVYEGLRATYESLQKTGQLERSDFFILSDSTDPDKQAEEERRWCDLVRELDALGRIYYRRRLANEGRKSGNVRDFLNAWGRRYRYFMVCDADSVMRGETLVNLVKLMEAHPAAGMIQTVPAVVNAESLFGRLRSSLTGFARRFLSPA